jgi:hypothetical protein
LSSQSEDERNSDAKAQQMGGGGKVLDDSYEEIAEELGRSKSDVYRVCQTLGCMSAS